MKPNRLQSIPLICALLAAHGMWLALCGPEESRAAQDLRDAPIQPFLITDFGGEVGLEFDYLSETQDQGGGSKLDFSNLSIEEYVLLRMQGYVYHPLFLDIHSEIKLGMLQQWLDLPDSSGDGSDDDSSNTFINGYNVRLDFLKQHPFSLSLFALREKDAVRELFSDQYLIENQSLGATANWKKGPFPMDLSVRQTKIWQDGFDSKTESTTNMVEYAVRNVIRDRMRTEFRYRHRDYEEHFETDGASVAIDRDTNLQSDDFNLNNSIFFNAARSSYLNTILRYYNQTGDHELDNWYWQERLNLNHTDNLDSYYEFSYLRNDTEGQIVETSRAEAGLNHQLYESLRSHADLHWRQTDYESSEDAEYGATGSLNYRKWTPWGHLSGGYSMTVDENTRKGGDGSRPIIDEALTLNDGFLSFLSEPGVILSSIQVTDLSGVVSYDEGFDYEIQVIGNRTGLRLLLGGRISDGESVLVDYTIEFTTDIDFTTIDQTFHIRHDFDRLIKALAVYFRWHDLGASGDIETDDQSILTQTDWLAGFEYHWRGIKWTEEYSDLDSNFTAYQQLRSQIEASYRLRNLMKYGWRAGHIMINYDDENLSGSDDNSRIWFLSALLSGAAGGRGHWELEAGARNETGLLEETTRGVSGKLGFRYRKVRFDGGARLEARERFDSKRDRMHLFFQVAREF